ncbi:MAG: zinc transporter ZupT [Oscillospiraceae bacterium]|nr:zinc transporter ZupT [Oscillospiraceae bacterium]
MDNNVISAMLLTLLAGLATGVGGIISLFTTRTNKKFLSTSLGFSAGVMIYIAFSEMLPKSQDYLVNSFGNINGIWVSSAAFFGGMIVIMLIDNLIPSPESDLTAAKAGQHDAVLQRMGILMALAIAVHNFPEGLATFTSTLDNIHLGAAIAIAIAIHNIPEGIVTSVPIYFATGNKRRAFAISLLSGLTEPAGALVGYLILRPFLGDTLYGVIFAAISGMMIYVSVEELIPMAREYDKGNTMILGCITGMAVMAVSLILFI